MKKRCCHKVSLPDCCPVPYPDFNRNFYAQFSVLANTPSGELIPMTTAFSEGTGIRLENETTIRLRRGFLYLINYVFLASPEPNNYMQIVPVVNGSLRLLYAFFAPSGAQERVTSAAASFTTNEAALADATLSFSLTYPPGVRNIDLSGAVSVTPLIKLPGRTS